MNPLKTVKYQTYLLQLENYALARFVKATLRSFPRSQAAKPKTIVWTAKLVLVFALGQLLKFGLAALLASLVPGWTARIAVFFVTAYIFALGFFVFLGLATAVVWPLDYVLKFLIISAAKRRLRKFSKLIIIGITGSYGKTTMKEVLATILQEDRTILKTPENINTPLGIARLILRELSARTEIFIVEMGAYRRGDIRGLCEIARPDVAILTGINQAHLERFGGMDKTVAAKFEIVRFAAPSAPVILNSDDELVMKNYQSFVGKKEVMFYSTGKRQCGDFTIGSEKFAENGTGWSFDLVFKNQNLGRFQVPFLGEYILGTIMGAAAVASLLGLPVEQIAAGIRKILPVTHRLQVLPNPNNIVVIDDSYNGNPNGAAEAIKVLGKFTDRRKIYITPGLVETGSNVKVVHETIGHNLAGVADIVILIKNSVTPYVSAGLLAAGFPQAKIEWFEDVSAAHAALPSLLRAGDVVLFQNDWPENYY